MGYIQWGGKKWHSPKPQRKRQPDINELMKPLSEKVGTGNLWGSVIMNVPQDGVTPPPVETYHLMDEASNPLLTEGGDFIDYDFVIPPTFDVDAQAYLDEVISQGGTIDATMSAATNTLFTELKSNGIYSKLTAMYPILGGTQNAHAVEALSPGGSYTLGFSGTWSHTSSGADPVSSSPYATTGLIPSSTYVGNAMSFGVYTTESNTAGDKYHLGAYVDNNNFTACGGRSGSVVYYNENNTFFTISDATSEGFLTASSDGANVDTRLFRSGSLVGSKSGAIRGTALASVQMYIGALNLNNSYYSSSNVNTNFVFFGEYLTSTEIGNFETIVQSFNTSLSRQV